ncbi:hypothetical protein RhiirC2_779800 [Rhizophagus irregularis]|uniref:Uncharacterized protein n=1 Tax=Rhizophagus irregularis TaxID=588596 RepID=A0A2N1N961_9GLOM|nr:hypothetical protein RhiirC2_779800 [Rhizophagus irregularis]
MVVYLLLESKYPKIYPWMSGEKCGYKILKVFDNFAEEHLATQLKIVTFFRLGRHDEISSIYIAQRFYEIHQNICVNLKYISLHRGCGTLDSIKRILKDTHDDYESLAKKIYGVIKKHFVIIDI